MTPQLNHVIAPGLAPALLLEQIYLNLRDFAIFTMDAQGLVTSWNLGAELIFGYAAQDMLGQHGACLFTATDRAEDQPQQEMRTAQQANRAADYRWHARRGGALFWADGVMTPLRGHDGAVIGYLKILRDITASKLAQDEARRLATIDVLTGLANRAAFDARRAEMMSFAERSGQSLLLLMIDLDQFKEVNDAHGHQAGDLLLQLTAQRLRAACRESDFVARLGGDEFALIQQNVASPIIGGMLAEKLLAELARPFQVSDREVTISASIGIAVCPLDAGAPDLLLKKADLALYHAKEAGRNCYRYYTAELDQMAHRKNADHIEMRRLMGGQSCGLAYQPILDADGRTIAMEALLRLPGYMGLGPVEYALGLAGEMGLLPELGAWVARQACEQLRAWKDAGLDGVRICINTCAKELRDAGYVAQLEATVADNGLLADDVEIELTERDVIELDRSGSKVVQLLHTRGFRLSLDDFGTGYSSLSYLRALPVSAIKLDKSFLCDVPDNADANAVVRMVVQLAHDLRLEVVAEGVEHHAQANFLGEAGCNAFQGYLYAPALAPQDAAAWLRNHH
ncbi:EAL domain-containing protein [Duganella sp. sic0402]|uniref:putative bifunctional diguanylate cyclase/phosphodiesterase n=1 Tax=Duganella sp. sic0402 TaxID=2854786 RepID=UPI001C47070D|nr:GGDEF and EAL domain-containing protein [Duganella sp. sic0402]MBV7536636.1 EAL domain-containing protein [Duganella sp. sic0402]